MKRVLIVVDVYHWAFGNIASGLQKYAPDDYEVDVVDGGTFCNMFPNSDCYNRYDAVCQCSWVESNTHLRRAGFTSVILAHEGAFFSTVDERQYAKMLTTKLRNYDKARFILPNFNRILVLNRSYWERAYSSWKHAVYTPQGVDTELFEMRGVANPGFLWVGQSDSLVKGIGIAQKISKRYKVHFHGRGPHDDPFSSEEMVDLYNRYSTYLCTSHSEGTPSSLLESLSCGLSVVTSKVGMVPELSPVIHKVYNRASDMLDDIPKPTYRRSSNRQFVDERYSWRVLAPYWLRAICGERVHGRSGLAWVN